MSLVFNLRQGLLVFFMTLTSSCFSLEAIEISKEGYFSVLGKHVDLFLDSTNQISVQEIVAGEQTPNMKWALNEPVHNNKVIGQNLWVFLEIMDHHETCDDFFLEIPDFHVSDVQVFEVENGEARLIYEGGFLDRFSFRAIKYKNPMVRIRPGLKTRYLVKLNSELDSSYKIHISTTQSKFNNALLEYLRFGLYYGILLTIGVYNLLIFFAVKDKTYFWYVVYIGSCVFYSFFTDGIGFHVFWPDQSWLNKVFIYPDLFLLFTFTIYSTFFLKLKGKWKYLLLSSLFIYSVVFVSNRFMSLVDNVTSWTFIFPYAILFVAAINQYIKGLVDRRYYILAFFCLLIGALVHVLMGKGLFPDNFFGVYAMNLGIVFEVLFFSLAQSDRLRIQNLERFQAKENVIAEQRKNEILKQKVNQELEQQVANRTKEIAQKNVQLEERNNELKNIHERLNEMNIKLDLDNWKLKKKVVVTNKQGLLRKFIEIGDFDQVFPTINSCVLYLSDQKWGDGFECRKCGNAKEKKGSTHEKKKCSKCNTIESATSGTLFHRLKFSLKDAFYIALITFKNHPITSKDLATKLELRESTCSTFRKKVEQAIKEQEPESFENLILIQK